MKDQPALIMFDGPDGVGKTTQLELVAAALQDQDYKVFTSHMLGGSETSEAIRELILSDLPRSAETNLHLSLAAYYALLEVVADKRRQGYIVLIDRSPLSLIAYQVYGDGLDQEGGFTACDQIISAFEPSAVFIYLAPKEQLQNRRRERSKQLDYFEKLPPDYHMRTLEGYAAAAKRYSTPIIDSAGDIQAVHDRTMELVKSLIGATS